MDKETLRMQMLSGIITESEYKAKLQENEEKESLNEHMIGGIVGIGAINQIPSRAKADYEDAFEHFLGQKYDLKEEIEEGKEPVNEALQNDDLIYDRMLDMDQEQLVSMTLSFAENNPSVTLVDYLNDKFGYEPELEEGKEVEEGKKNNEIINIPQEYSALRDILGDKSSSNDIIKIYNERVVPKMDTIALEVYEDGYFWNKVMDDIMVDTILSQLNSTLS